MNLEEFKKNIEQLLPVKRTTEDFIKDLNSSLNSYLKLIKSLDTEITERYENWNDRISRINSLVTGIKNCAKSYYEGMHSASFSILKEQMTGNQYLKGIFETIDLCTFKEGSFFYRARIFENSRPKSYEEMLHIPFEKRGKIQTQRYSLPGYPCLYLGTTIYACWEELKRPKFDNLMISGFEVTRDIKLFDLRIPSANEYIESKLENLLLRLPIIIACSIIVPAPNDNFKPEYIIPQLLIEVIISNIKESIITKDIDELVLGIIYTSTHINNDFNYSDHVFENIAIPAVEVLQSNGHCEVLKGCFKTTTPTCNEYEEIREEFPIFNESSRIADNSISEQCYKFSKMGKLEARIKELPLNQLPYIYICPKVLRFEPNDLRPKEIRVHSNCSWESSIQQATSDDYE